MAEKIGYIVYLVEKHHMFETWTDAHHNGSLEIYYLYDTIDEAIKVRDRLNNEFSADHRQNNVKAYIRNVTRRQVENIHRKDTPQ